MTGHADTEFKQTVYDGGGDSAHTYMGHVTTSRIVVYILEAGSLKHAPEGFQAWIGQVTSGSQVPSISPHLQSHQLRHE